MPHRPRKEGFKVLGTVLTWDNTETKEVQNRVARAWQAFYKHKKQLTDRLTPFLKRVDILDRAVRPAIMYGLETIHLRRHNVDLITTTQESMLRAMMKMNGACRSGEEYVRAQRRILAKYREKGVVKDWGLYARARMYKWAGHVARMERYMPERWAAKVLAHRDRRCMTALRVWTGSEGHEKGAH